MAKTETVIIWEQSLYCHALSGGWRRFPLARLEDAVALLQEHLRPKTSIALIYDPDILLTEYTDCPMGGRPIVREALAATHETIANMHTAWGIQTPTPIAGVPGSASTFCSYENAPALYALTKTLEKINRPVVRAFPFISVALQAGISPGRTSLFLVMDEGTQAFIFLSTATGVRACRKLYAGKRAGEYDIWAEINLVLAEYGVSFDDGGQRPQVRIYQAPGTDAKTQCNYWGTLQQMAQVELFGINSLGSLLSNLPAHHPSALMADMPKTISLDKGLQVIASICFAGLVGFGGFAFYVLSGEAAELKKLRTEQTGLKGNQSLLQSNKREIETLQDLYSKEIFEDSLTRVNLLEALPKVIPEGATLFSIIAGVGDSRDVKLHGTFWNMDTGKTVAMAPMTRAAAGNNVTLITPITLELTKLFPGLQVETVGTQVSMATGEFTISAKIPLSESAVAKAAAAPAPAAAPKTAVSLTAKPAGGKKP